MATHHLHVFTSRSQSLVKPFLPPFISMPIKRYGEARKVSHSHHEDEKAPSLAQEFERVAEEAEQGCASQTVDKAYDAAEEAIRADSDLESIKNKYKEHQPGATYRTKPSNED